MTKNNNTLLKAIEMILADPSEIKSETKQLIRDFENRYKNEFADDEIKDKIADKIISKYSSYTGYVGVASALTGVIPGLGTVIAASGGATADAALSMKYQIEMVMALAVVHGHDITLEEEKRLCFMIAGLIVIKDGAKEGINHIGSKAFVKMTQQYLKGASLQAVKEIFKKVGITFTRKAVEKTIPFGIGVIIAYSANKGLSRYVGTKAHDSFRIY